MDNTEASPAKPKKWAREKLNATIHVLHNNPDKGPPLVAYFPSSFDPSSRLRGSSANPGVRVYHHSKRPNRLQLVNRLPESIFACIGSTFCSDPLPASSIVG
ncbi:hypothetical protein NL676_035533 [Syzygium grande]|nr:hypothetical protein NL676_035533 [Syzygium grande]